MRYFINREGSMTAVCCIVLFIVVCMVLEVNRIYLAAGKVMEDQNKKDAHVLSVIGLYSDTVNEVSWANKQLKRIGLLSSVLVFTPQLAGLVKVLDAVCSGLQKYQDFLLLRLKVYAPILDLKLRRTNGLGMVCGIHYLTYRRQPPIDLFFMTIPGLIEFNKDIFDTACIKHRSGPVPSYGCLYSRDYSSTKENWFAPTKSSWGGEMKNAY